MPFDVTIKFGTMTSIEHGNVSADQPPSHTKGWGGDSCIGIAQLLLTVWAPVTGLLRVQLSFATLDVSVTFSVAFCCVLVHERS